MRAGVFPNGHPAAGKAGHNSECGSSHGLIAFRGRGYWASCFPEGDGITFYHETDEQIPAEHVIQDITECFGWEVSYDRGL